MRSSSTTSDTSTRPRYPCQIDRPATVDEVKGLTGNQKDIAKRGARLVSAIREAVRRRADGIGLQKAVGVGSRVYGNNARSVATALETILDAADKRADELRACGIMEADLKTVRAIFATLSGARGTQDQGMLSKKDLTKQKDKVQLQVEADIEAISTAGALQYLESDPVLAERFESLIPSSGGGGNAAAEPTTPSN